MGDEKQGITLAEALSFVQNRSPEEVAKFIVELAQQLEQHRRIADMVIVCPYCNKVIAKEDSVYSLNDDVTVCGACYKKLRDIKDMTIEAYKKYQWNPE